MLEVLVAIVDRFLPATFRLHSRVATVECNHTAAYAAVGFGVDLTERHNNLHRGLLSWSLSLPLGLQKREHVFSFIPTIHFKMLSIMGASFRDCRIRGLVEWR
jgi:hypothetical protein